MLLRRPVLALTLLILPSAFPAEAAEALPPVVRAFVRHHLELSAYRSAAADLDGDGRPEFVVYAEGVEHCGTGGCTLFVVRCRNSDCRTVLYAPTVRPPVRVLPTRSNGWRDLAVLRAGGGHLPSTERLRFDPPGGGEEVAVSAEMAAGEDLDRVLIAE